MSSLRVLTFNTFARPSGVNEGKNKRNDLKNERLDSLLPLLSEYDVVCLQELFSVGSSRQPNFIKRAQEDGFHFFATSSAPSLCSKYMIDSGLLMLSRYPLQGKDELRFSAGIGIDGVVAKGVLYARVIVSPTTSFHLFTTHTQAGGTQNSWNVRKAQFDEMSQFVLEKTTDGEPIVMLGDLNTNSRHAAKSDGRYEYMLGVLQRARSERPIVDLAREHYGYAPVTNGWGHGVINTKKPPTLCEEKGKEFVEFRKCIDYILFVPPIVDDTNDTKYRTAPIPEKTKIVPFCVSSCHNFTQLSDHYGVETELSLPENRPKTGLHSSSSKDYVPRRGVWIMKPCIAIMMILTALLGIFSVCILTAF